MLLGKVEGPILSVLYISWGVAMAKERRVILFSKGGFMSVSMWQPGGSIIVAYRVLHILKRCDRIIYEAISGKMVTGANREDLHL